MYFLLKKRGDTQRKKLNKLKHEFLSLIKSCGWQSLVSNLFCFLLIKISIFIELFMVICVIFN